MDLIAALTTGVSGVLWFIVPFVIVLSVVVFFHELGHFAAARWCGVRVETFSIGFGRELFGWVDRHGTRWRIAILPLGGYVKFWGDADATTSRVDDSAMRNASPEQLAGSFHRKPLYQKAFIAAAGPLANFILAVVIFAGMNMIVGERMLPPRIGDVAKDSPASAAGLQIGDLVKTVNGDAIRSFTEFAKAESLSAGLPMRLEIERDGAVLPISVTPRLEDVDDGQGGKVAIPSIGVQPFLPPYVTAVLRDSPAQMAGLAAGDLILSIDGVRMPTFAKVVEAIGASQGKPVLVELDRKGRRLALTMTPQANPDKGARQKFLIGIRSDATQDNYGYKIDTVYHGPTAALTKAVGDVGFIVTKIGEFFYQLATGAGDYRQLSGPIGIAKVSSDVAQVSLASLVHLIAVLSVSIGLLNLLPIPILDGGHLLYYAIEGIRGQPLGERAQEFGFRVGLVFVLGLMLVATWNDIAKVPSWLF